MSLIAATCLFSAVLAVPTQAGADSYRYKAKTFTSGAGLITFASVKCGDDPVVGGGLSQDTDDLWLTASNLTSKLSFVDLPRNSWLGVYSNTDMVLPHDMKVTAICQKQGGDDFVYRTDDVKGPPDSETKLNVSCKGDPVVGGGVYPVDPDAQLANISRPTGGGNGWIGGAYNFANNNQRLAVTAICEKNGNDNFDVEKESIPVGPSSFGTINAGCGGNDKLVGGGFAAADDPLDFRLHRSSPVAQHGAWGVTGTNFDMALQNQMTAFAICER